MSLGELVGSIPDDREVLEESAVAGSGAPQAEAVSGGIGEQAEVAESAQVAGGALSAGGEFAKVGTDFFDASRAVGRAGPNTAIRALNAPLKGHPPSAYLVETATIRPGQPTHADKQVLRFSRATRDGGKNGLYAVDLLAVVLDRLEAYQWLGVYANPHYAKAIDLLLGALDEIRLGRAED